jgi:hypothetical protein
MALVTLTRRASSVQVEIPSTMSVISTGPVSLGDAREAAGRFDIDGAGPVS